MKTKLFSFAVVLLTALLISSCDAEDHDEHDHTGGAVSENTPSVITNIYSPIECTLTDGFSYENGISPFYDEYTGTLTVLGSLTSETENEDGTIENISKYHLFTFDVDGNLTNDTEISLIGSPDCGQILDMKFVYITDDPLGQTIHIYDRTGGEQSQEKALSEITGEDILYAFFDTDGELILGDHEVMFVLDDDLDLKNTIYFDGSLLSVFPHSNGQLLGLLEKTDGKYLAETDKNSGVTSVLCTLDDDTLTISCSATTNDTYLCYFDTPTAVYGISINDTGKYETSLLIDYENSGIINNAELAILGIAADGTRFRSVFFEDLMLFCKTVYRNEVKLSFPILYRTDEDIDLSEVTVIELAYAHSLDDNIRAQMIDFDAKHRDVNVVTLDYSRYATTDDPNAGEWKLITDILNGIISPDIVFGDPKSSDMVQLMEKKLFTDLTPYFENDDTVNPDTVFGCVKRAFTDGDGKMWGITPFFSLHTLVSTEDMLGEYADLSVWSLEDFLDFSEKHSTVMFDLTREFVSTYMNNVYADFCDTKKGVCEFDSELFKRYIEFLKALPTDAEYSASSEYGSVSITERYPYYRDGIVPLRKYSLGEGVLAPRYYFGVKDYKLIGFPTSGDTGAMFATRMAFVVTSSAEAPEICWEFIKSFMHNDYSMWISDPGMTAMKEEYIELIEGERGDIRVYEDGVWVSNAKAAMFEAIGMPFSTAPYTVEEWDEATAENSLEYLDSEGMRLSDRLPTAVTDIVNEELSAFFAGQGNADDCAKKIQSRVSIWLSENLG